MKKGINYWSFPGGLEGTLAVADAIALAKKFGFEALELSFGLTGAVSVNSTEAEAKEWKRLADEAGIALDSACSGTYWTRALGDPDPETAEAAFRDVESMIKISSWMGASTLLTIPGKVDLYTGTEPGYDYAEVYELAIKQIQRLVPVAAEFGVKLAIENVWNKFLLSPREMAAFIDQFDSPWVAAYVDVANMLLYGYPEQWLRILNHRVAGVHFKDFRRSVATLDGFVDLLEGDVNWPAVIEALKAIGYRGPCVAEMVPLYQHYPLVRVANTSKAMDAILERETL
jgi:hexulose-6-phosphate isomerase